MSGADRPRVLFVDDEPNIVQALSRQVHGFASAAVSTSPVEAAALLEQIAARHEDGFAVIVSDMRMPVMDGATFLKHAAQVCPDSTRILLTGHADLDSAIAAVNDGSVFRFLTKPCPAPTLHATLRAAVEQHQLIRDRRELLEQTLRGAVEALVETLAMAHPEAFARAARLRRLTQQVAERLSLPDRWQVEVAAQLGEIGAITLPPPALVALSKGQHHDKVIGRMLDALPELAEGVLRRIPRMEPVRQIVREQQPVGAVDEVRFGYAGRGARLLQAIREYDALRARGRSPDDALNDLRDRDYHDAEVLDALAETVLRAEGGTALQVMDAAALTEGMQLGADLYSAKGTLLVGQGQTLTPELLARIRNFAELSGLRGRPVVQIEV
jgi:FixJ family two-component response regulator